MKITPLDIRKQDFTRRLRGYDPEEVQAFLHALAAQWDGVLEEGRRQDEKLREMENKLRHYERVEEALQEALQTARESARQAMQAAEQKAQQIRGEAEGDADRIKRDAEQERIRIRQETHAIHNRRKEIVARLRAFLLSEMEMLAHFEGEDPIGFIKLMPAEQQRRLVASIEREAEEEEHDDAPRERRATLNEDWETDTSTPAEEAFTSFFTPDRAEAAELAEGPGADAFNPSRFGPPSEPHDAADVLAPSADPVEATPETSAPEEDGAPAETMGERLLRLDQEAALTPPEEPGDAHVWTTPAKPESATPPAEADEAPAEGAPEDASDAGARPGWRQKSIIGTSAATGRTPSETVSAAEEEIARIRRILSQLD